MTSENLISLHTALIDAREGYRKAIEEAESPAIVEQLRSVERLHAAAHARIHGILTARGEAVDDGGSFMGTIHKAVVSVRSATFGLDEGSLGSFASGEENNLEAYDEAIGAEHDPALRAQLTSHRDALAEQVRVMKQKAQAV
jgi:uncharacterized protein (TIGR02284 family)